MRYLTIPDLYFTDGSINSPSCPTALDMLKVESTLATVRLRTEIAIWLPGHILVDRLSPSNSTHTRAMKEQVPSTKPKCHQFRISDAWIKLAVLQISFGIERCWIGIVSFVVEHRPVLKRERVQQLYQTAKPHGLTRRSRSQ